MHAGFEEFWTPGEISACLYNTYTLAHIDYPEHYCNLGCLGLISALSNV